MRVKHFLMGLALCIALFRAEAARAALDPPFDPASVRATAGAEDKAPFSCPQPPAPLVDLHFESMYKKGDKSHSIVDPRADAAYKKAYAPISAFEKGLNMMANRYARSKPPRADVAACALDWIAAWARAGALQGDVNRNGEYIRKWAIGSIANGFMQVRDAEGLDAGKKKDGVEWIRTVGRAAMADFSRGADKDSRRNNHLYWAAWGVASAAMATDDADMFSWAMEKERFGLQQIEEDGTMPLELGRRKRAYLYHLFAAMPLFFLAEAGARNGKEDLFSSEDGALKKLGDICLRNIGTGKDFEKLTGEAQEMARAGTPSDLGWVEIYDRHYPGNPQAQAVLKKFRPMRASRMGGNITLLYAPGAAGPADAPVPEEGAGEDKY
jgi:poly(beta-D-mannuronate) lyase